MKAVVLFCLVSMSGEVKAPTMGICVTCRGIHDSEINHFCVSPIMLCLDYTYLRPKCSCLSTGFIPQQSEQARGV